MKLQKIFILLLVMSIFPVLAENDSLATCYPWAGGGFDSLQQAVTNNTCVEIQAGTYDIAGTEALSIPSGHTLTGKGYTNSTLRLTSVHDCPAPSHDTEPIIKLVDASNVTISYFRLTGSYQGVKKAVNGITVTYSDAQANDNGVLIENMQIDGVRCDGVSLGGNGTTFRNNILTDCGGECNLALPTACDPGYGCGIHAMGVGAMYSYATVIHDNNIYQNQGAAVDIVGVDDGQFYSNSVWNNGGFAGFALFGGHNWHIYDNLINNSGGQHLMGHSHCNKGDVTIGILLCADNSEPDSSNNIIEGNLSQGDYGILLIGKDDTCKLPESNYIYGNDVFGSTIGCADDNKPNDSCPLNNTWTNNSCRGYPNSPPNYF